MNYERIAIAILFLSLVSWSAFGCDFGCTPWVDCLPVDGGWVYIKR